MNTHNSKQIINSLLHFIQSIFLNGLLVLLPITLTITVIRYSIKLMQGWLQPIRNIQPLFFKQIPYSEFLTAVVAIFIVGIIFKSFFLRRFLDGFEKTFFSLPLMRQLYFGIKQIVLAFTTKDQLTFQRVVLVQFPRKELYSIGFLISETPVMLLPTTEKKYYNVYVATTPNPTSGFLIIVASDEIIDVDITRQEAMSLIISGGIIRPERYGYDTKANNN